MKTRLEFLLYAILALALTAATAWSDENGLKSPWLQIYELASHAQLREVNVHSGQTLDATISEFSHVLERQGFPCSFIVRMEGLDRKSKMHGINLRNCRAHEALWQFAKQNGLSLQYENFGIVFGKVSEHAVFVHGTVSGPSRLTATPQRQIFEFGPVGQFAMHADGRSFEMLMDSDAAGKMLQRLEMSGRLVSYSKQEIEWPRVAK
jgi:hypothetical protein